MPNTLLPVPHFQQREDADCLAACAAMLLSYVNVRIDYSQLLRLLKVKAFGTPGHNLNYLSTLGVRVTYRESSMRELIHLITTGTPCIALVKTAELPYWNYSTDHAVVVVGIGNSSLFLNDPAFPEASIEVDIEEFELAWMEFDYRLGFIAKT